jgi:hypothetical protein
LTLAVLQDVMPAAIDNSRRSKKVL